MRRVLAVVLGLAALAPAAHAGSLPENGTRLVGAAASGSFGELPAPVEFAGLGPSSVSQTGRYVAFSTSSTGLVDGVDDGYSSVYVKDRQTGAVELASRTDSGSVNHSDCQVPSLSGSGRRVVFLCDGPLVTADTNGKPDVYLRDLDAQTTTLVSRSAAAIGAGTSGSPAISANGLFAAFASSSDLTASPIDLGGTRIYRRDLGGTGVVLVDPAANPAVAPNGESDNPAISPDGTRIAYQSYASNLVTGVTDANNQTDVFWRDLGASATHLVSAKSADATMTGDLSSSDAVISGPNALSHAYVAFVSQADNLTAGDHDTSPDVIRRDIDAASPSYQVISQNSSATKSDGVSLEPSVSATGDVVSFASSATNLATGVPGIGSDQVYRRQVSSGITSAVSRRSGSSGAFADDAGTSSVSGDGTVVAIGATGLTDDAAPQVDQVYARVDTDTTLVSRPAGSAPYVNLGGDARTPGPDVVSADGRYTLFTSEAAGLLSTPFAGAQLWRRDNLSGDVVLVSRADGAAGALADNQPLGTAAISADGNRVAFTAIGNAFGLGVPADRYGVYLRDIGAATTVLASRAADNSPLEANDAVLSADGQHVAFNSGPRLYVRDLAKGVTVGVPDTPGREGQPGLSADGGRVAWVSFVPDPDEGDYPVDGHAYVADVGATDATQLDNGASVKDAPRNASISDDGSRVAFSSPAQLVPADTDTTQDAYVVDVASGARTRITAGPSGLGAPQLSADGRKLAFLTKAALAVSDTNGAVDAYVADVAGGATALASRGDGAAGPGLATKDAETVALDADGGCVTFETEDAGLAPGLDADLVRVWLRAVSGTCPAAPAAPAATATATPSPSPTATATPTARTKPKVTKFRAKPKRFKTRGKQRGTTFSFTLDQAATVKIVIRRGKKRVATLKVKAKAGKTKLRFRRRHLKAGRYRATLTATSAGGSSKPQSLKLRAIRRSRRS